jgi:hypothetical protein
MRIELMEKSMSLKRIPWVTIAVLVAVFSAAAFALATNEYKWSDPKPPLTEVGDLATRTVVEDVGLTLESPGTDLKAAVSAEQAVSEAWKEEGAPGDPQGVHATFASLHGEKTS